MASLSFQHVYKKYDGGVVAVSDFNLEVADKEFVILVGPSGCGPELRSLSSHDS